MLHRGIPLEDERLLPASVLSALSVSSSANNNSAEKQHVPLVYFCSSVFEFVTQTDSNSNSSSGSALPPASSSEESRSFPPLRESPPPVPLQLRRHSILLTGEHIILLDEDIGTVTAMIESGGYRPQGTLEGRRREGRSATLLRSSSTTNALEMLLAHSTNVDSPSGSSKASDHLQQRALTQLQAVHVLTSSSTASPSSTSPVVLDSTITGGAFPVMALLVSSTENSCSRNGEVEPNNSGEGDQRPLSYWITLHFPVAADSARFFRTLQLLLADMAVPFVDASSTEPSKGASSQLPPSSSLLNGAVMLLVCPPRIATWGGTESVELEQQSPQLLDDAVGTISTKPFLPSHHWHVGFVKTLYEYLEYGNTVLFAKGKSQEEEREKQGPSKDALLFRNSTDWVDPVAPSMAAAPVSQPTSSSSSSSSASHLQIAVLRICIPFVPATLLHQTMAPIADRLGHLKTAMSQVDQSTNGYLVEVERCANGYRNTVLDPTKTALQARQNQLGEWKMTALGKERDVQRQQEELRRLEDQITKTNQEREFVELRCADELLAWRRELAVHHENELQARTRLTEAQTRQSQEVQDASVELDERRQAVQTLETELQSFHSPEYQRAVNRRDELLREVQRKREETSLRTREADDILRIEGKQISGKTERLQSTLRALETVIRQAEAKMEQEREDRVDLENDARNFASELQQLQSDTLLMEAQMLQLAREKRQAQESVDEIKRAVQSLRRRLAEQVHRDGEAGDLAGSPRPYSPSSPQSRRTRHRYDPTVSSHEDDVSSHRSATIRHGSSPGTAGSPTVASSSSQILSSVPPAMLVGADYRLAKAKLYRAKKERLLTEISVERSESHQRVLESERMHSELAQMLRGTSLVPPD